MFEQLGPVVISPVVCICFYHQLVHCNITSSLSLSPQLFDFDIEVKPILEVLVGKTVEQALLEVMEEEELANLRAQQRQFKELRNAELVETQRLEEQERRHREEKERRMRQQAEVLRKEKETGEKISARAFAQVINPFTQAEPPFYRPCTSMSLVYHL